jgi:hypothetical protein
MSQNIGTINTAPGGTQNDFDITAAAVVKAAPGTIMRVNTLVVGTGGNLVVNDTNSLVTAQTITGISVAAQAVITLSTGGSANPFAVGESVIVTSATGMTQINGLVGTVTAVGGASGAWTVTTNINSTAFTAWASGGTAASYAVQNEVASIPYGDLAATAPYELSFPCRAGITISAVPTGGWVGSVSFI